MSSEPVPLWLDCDPGHDDAFAILLAAYHPGIQLLGISTVHGNAPLTKTTNNALSILSAIGKADNPSSSSSSSSSSSPSSIKVYPGSATPLHRPPVNATAIHGETGLDGTSLLPSPALHLLDSSSTSAIEAMATSLLACAPNTAWIAATGATTNVAALFAAYPELRHHVRGVSIMGGSVGGKFTPAVMGRVDDVERIGNYTQWAEFNVLIDPEAAKMVLEDEVLRGKCTLVPLDLTHLVLADGGVQRLLLRGRDEDGKGEGEGEGKGKEAKSTLRQMLVELLMFFAETYRDVFGIIEGPPLHDPLAVAAILTGTKWEIPFYDFDPANPGGPKQERFDVHVITEGSVEDALLNRAQTGRTVVKPLEPGQPGVRIPRGVDVDLFWRVVEECIQRADEVNAKRGVF
ncbi:Inosine/uridine-preferring nucleoside hydrolase [Poronia punctata]|nr:Inosine/uridine-preferring nucleoside hydrolase [Poronia punctata]